MYKCKPERNAFKARLLVIICVAVTAFTFLAGSVMENNELTAQFAAAVRFLGIAFLMTSILLVVKYTLTELEYTLDGDDLIITKILGNRRTDMVCVNLETAICLMEKSDYRKLPKNEKATLKYVLNQNMHAQSFVYLCEFNGKRAMVEFEPNAAFVAILNDAIAECKKRSDSQPR